MALLGVAGVIAGAGIGFGWLPPLLMVPYAATFVTQVSTVRSAVTYGAIVAIAALYGVVLARRFGAPDVADGDRLAPPVAASVAIVFGAVLAASAAIGVALGWTEPYWVAEPVLILVLYILMGKRERIREKALGTALGVAAAVPVAILSPPPEVLTAVGAVVFLVALTQAKGKYWLMYGLYTFSSAAAGRTGRGGLRGRGARLPDPRGHRPPRRRPGRRPCPRPLARRSATRSPNSPRGDNQRRSRGPAAARCTPP